MNAKKKGNHWENKITNYLRDHGIKAWRDNQSGGGNREKGDVGNNLDMTIESKAAKNIKLMDWWKQVERSATIHHNQPVLFIHQDKMPDNEWIVCMHSEDWIDMVKKQSEHPVFGSKLTSIEQEQSKSRNISFKLENARQAVKLLLKAIDD
jgi:Holliday junction resolvase